MNVGDLLGGFQDPGSYSNAGEELFYRRQRGEISYEDYRVQTAMFMASILHKYPEPVYPVPSAILSQYLQDRLAGKIDRHPVLAVKNGEWLLTLREQKYLGEGNRILFIDAIELLRSKGLREQAHKVEREVRRIDLTGFPEQGMRGMIVQRMDSEERRRNERT